MIVSDLYESCTSHVRYTARTLHNSTVQIASIASRATIQLLYLFWRNIQLIFRHFNYFFFILAIYPNKSCTFAYRIDWTLTFPRIG